MNISRTISLLIIRKMVSKHVFYPKRVLLKTVAMKASGYTQQDTYVTGKHNDEYMC
jgi:hypothetical protein